MENLDQAAIMELAAILKERGVSYHSGLNITLTVRRNPTAMINWLKENPQATKEEVARKALELGKAGQAILPTAPTMCE